MLKKGYQITVVSWENDADNYKTEIVSGLSEARTKLYVDLLKLVSRGGEFGNSSDGDLWFDTPKGKRFYQKAREILLMHIKEVQSHCHGSFNFDSDDDIHDYVLCNIYPDLIGSSEYYDTRIAEKITITYIPEDIVLQDVTSQFI